MDKDLIAVAAMEARDIIDNAEWNTPWRTMNGVEMAPGLFNVYNDITGQSKTVLLNLEIGYIFKHYYASNKYSTPGSYIGSCVMEGVEYQIRLPRWYVFDDICAQEWINAPTHDCGDWSCDHAQAVRTGTGYMDCHVGNWKIFNGEIVLFDFD